MAPFFVSYFRCCLCRPSELGCKSELGLLGCRAVPTRCKYVHVSSRFSSMKTDGRRNPAPQAAYTLRAADGFSHSNSEASAVALGRLRYDRLMSWMTSTSPHGRVHGVS